MRWEYRSKDSSTRNRKRKVFNMLQSLWRESEGPWKRYNLNCLFKLWIWCTTKTKKVKLIFLSTIKRSYCPLSPIPWTVLSTVLPLAYLAYNGGQKCWDLFSYIGKRCNPSLIQQKYRKPFHYIVKVCFFSKMLSMRSRWSVCRSKELWIRCQGVFGVNIQFTQKELSDYLSDVFLIVFKGI